MKWFLLTILSTSLWAAPRELEVWYVSNKKVSQVLELLNRPHYKIWSKTAELECQQMGDYCFDPQYGLYKRDDDWNQVDATKVTEDTGPKIPSAKSVDRDLINCDPNNYFDVFCGKARPEAKGVAKLDVWIDTSSSMREFDFSDKDGNCSRKSLLKALDETCGFNQKVNVMMFDTSLKQAGGMDVLCNNQGLNDYKRLMDWIERAETQRLIVITDIYELHKDFSDFVEKKNGKIRGDKDPLTTKDMLNLANHLANLCK